MLSMSKHDTFSFPMRNIELKVQTSDHEQIRRRLKSVGALYKGKLLQTDTYFAVNRGRLKIREINRKEFELISYKRPNVATHKQCDFEVLKLSKREAMMLHRMLSEALGILVTVVKCRELWMFGNTRIHLDSIRGLGTFLELESQVVYGIAKARKEYDKIYSLLELGRHKKIKGSYSDLLTKKH